MPPAQSSFGGIRGGGPHILHPHSNASDAQRKLKVRIRGGFGTGAGARFEKSPGELELQLGFELGAFGRRRGIRVRTGGILKLSTLGAGKLRIQDPKVLLGNRVEIKLGNDVEPRATLPHAN